MMESLFNRLAAAIGILADQELRSLASILRLPDAGSILAELAETTLAFRKLQRKSGKKASPQGTPVQNESRPAVISSDVAVADDGEPGLRGAIASVLNDRAVYPSTREVVVAINSAFNLEFRYEDFKRRGRRDLIERCWSSLAVLSPKNRHELLKRFFESVAGRYKKMDMYDELFKTLTGNE